MDSAPARSRNTDVRSLVRAQLEVLLEQDNLEGAKALLVPVQPADIADAIEDLPRQRQAIAFRLLSKDEAIEVYEHIDTSVQQSLLEVLKSQEVLDIVDRMSPDDRVRLFDELPAKVVRQLLVQMSQQERDATAMMLGYEADTAGRIMTPEYIALKEGMTVSASLDYIRSLAEVKETIYYLYTTDQARRLRGILSLRDLVVARPQQTIGEIMTRDVVAMQTDADQEEVARVIQRYDFLAVPIVDREERLVGIVTVDDILDVLEAEATEDIYAQGGVQTGDSDDYFQTNLLTVARRRVVWLLVLLLTNTGTSAVMSSQEDVLDAVRALGFFVPLLIGTGGNVGAQSSTVVIRGLNTDRIRSMGPAKVIAREATAGLFLGLMLAVVAAVWVYFLQKEVMLSLTVGISLAAISVLASTAGSSLPLLFQKIGLDPALMSAPFITTVVDVLGVFIYLSVARAIILN